MAAFFVALSPRGAVSKARKYHRESELSCLGVELSPPWQQRQRAHETSSQSIGVVLRHMGEQNYAISDRESSHL